MNTETTASNVVVRELRGTDTAAAERAFAALDADPDTRRWFHPHPLTAAEARRVCSHGGRDVHLGAFLGPVMVGYALLRGWDEGFDVPSFGVAVIPQQRGAGVGEALASAAIELARASDAEEVLLHVHPSNRLATRWYERLGFTPSHMRDDGLVAYRLRLAGGT